MFHSALRKVPVSWPPSHDGAHVQEIVARFAELLENGADVAGTPAAVQLDHQMHKYHDVRIYAVKHAHPPLAELAGPRKHAW